MVALCKFVAATVPTSTATARAAISSTRRAPILSSTARAQRDEVGEQRAPDHGEGRDDEYQVVHKRTWRATSSETRADMKYAYTKVYAPSETMSVTSIGASSAGEPAARRTVGS